MSAESSDAKFEQFRDCLNLLIANYRRGEMHRIGYGNLRQEYSSWNSGELKTTNAAIIYETPGGSTAQINVVFSHSNGSFEVSTDPDRLHDVIDEVLVLVQAEVDRIPERRRQVLLQQIDRWIASGLTTGAFLGEMNKLLQQEFVGGRINLQELKEGIRYGMERLRGSGRAGPPAPEPSPPAAPPRA